MCFLVGFHDKGARALRRHVFGISETQVKGPGVSYDDV
jgi:hypothetical protein